MRLFKLTTLLLLIVNPALFASEDDCGGLVRRLLLTQKETYTHERIIAKETDKLQTAEDLFNFFKAHSKVGDANDDYLKGFSEYLFPEITKEGRLSTEKFIRKVLQSFKHERDSQVFFELVSFARGEHMSADYIVRNMGSAISNEDFVTFYKTGKTAFQNEDFLLSLEKAIQDVKAFDPMYGKRVHVEKSMESILDLFIEMDDPILVGKFITKFQQMDQLTRQYFLDQVSTYKRGGENYHLIFKFSRENEGDLVANQKGLVDFLSKDLEDLKITAYFKYTSNGNSAHPEIVYSQDTIDMAVKYLEKLYRKENSMGFDEDFPQQFLIDSPISDESIDQILAKGLAKGDDLPKDTREYFISRFANMEIDLELRNAKGLGNIEIDFRFLLEELRSSAETRPRVFHEIFRLDQEVGLEKYPEVKAAFKKYIDIHNPDFNSIFLFEDTPPEFLEMVKNL